MERREMTKLTEETYQAALMESVIGRVMTLAEGGDEPELTLVDVKQGKTDDCWRMHREVGRNRRGDRGYRSHVHGAYCPSTKIRIFPQAKGETVLTWLTNRRFVPAKELRPLVREALTRLGYPTTVKFRWNQYAGCSCPCSPAFVADVAGENIDFTYKLSD